jgi:prepilin-type N-terminal cleavage/methylation domain-containing protein/prepilin-type processing-associated H-X9-DG protein
MLTNPATLQKALLLSKLYSVKTKRKKSDARLHRPKAAPKTVRLGFSLIELLLVISIIALLLSILMPALGKARSAAMRLKCTHNLKQINLAMLLYLEANNQTYPCAEDPFLGDFWLWMGVWSSFVEPYLGGQITDDRPSIMACPENTTVYSFGYAYSMSFYHSPEQIDTMDSYEDTFMPTSVQPSIPQRSSNVARPAHKILIGEWYSNHLPIDDDQGWWCWQGSRNYLFADGHVSFLEAQQIRTARDGLPDPHLTFRGIKGVDWLP